jgi:hypothetical protein
MKAAVNSLSVPKCVLCYYTYSECHNQQTLSISSVTNRNCSKIAVGFEVLTVVLMDM